MFAFTVLCFHPVFSYCLVREAKKPSFVRLDQRSNEELKTRTKQLCEVVHGHVYVRLQCMVVECKQYVKVCAVGRMWRDLYRA